MVLPHIKTPTEIYRTEYPEVVEFTKRQLDTFWTADEIKVEKDIHDVLTNFTESERHGVMTTLRNFTRYEMEAGSEYWTGRFMGMFPRHEFQAMGATFGMMELAVHAKFYNKINELLNATDDDFYTDYVKNPTLRARMDYIDEIINHPNDLISLAGFTLVEGVILYSSFAFLKHFQSLGKNKLVNVVAGINSSAIDEDLHQQAGAWCFNELVRQSELHLDKWTEISSYIYQMAEVAYEHESLIIDMIFEKGDIEGITKEQMKCFVQHRVNKCLVDLGMSARYSMSIPELEQHGHILKWFYRGMNCYIANDFFTRVGREYQRSWNEKDFTWK